MAHNEQRRARAKVWAAEVDAARRRAGLIFPGGLAERASWLRRVLSEWAIAGPPPGIEHVDRLVDHQDAVDRIERARQFVKINEAAAEYLLRQEQLDRQSDLDPTVWPIE